MLVSGDHFGRHVSRCPRGILLILGRIYPSDSHVGQPQIPLRVKDQIFRFDVPVNDAVLVQVFQAENDAADEELDDVFGELFDPANLEPEVATWHVVHDQVEIGPILEGVDHVHQKRVLQLAQQLPLVHHRSHAVFGQDSETKEAYTDFDISFIA